MVDEAEEGVGLPREVNEVGVWGGCECFGANNLEVNSTPPSASLESTTFSDVQTSDGVDPFDG